MEFLVQKVVEKEKMTRGKSSRLRLSNREGWHKFKIIKARVKVGKYIYKVWQIIDRTENKSRLVIEAPPKIRKLIAVGLYTKLRN